MESESFCGIHVWHISRSKTDKLFYTKFLSEKAAVGVAYDKEMHNGNKLTILN